MSRTSPLVTPVIDEDFDLCISETNLPFPYSDHCSTGPPSLYEFDEDDEEEEGDYEEDEDEEDEGIDEDEDEQEEQVLVRKEILVDADSDEDPSSTVAPLRRSNSARALTDFQRQLQTRLESIQDQELWRDTESTFASPTGMTAPSPGPRLRPRFNHRPYSYDSQAGWQDDEEYEATHCQEGQEDEQRDNEGLLSTVTSAVTSVAYAVGKHWSKKIYDTLLRSQDPKAWYTHLLKVATNYEQWAEAAAILDKLQGKDKWKNDPKSPYYDYEMLQDRLSQLARARESGDLGLMIFLLRTSLSRNLGNVGRRELYAETNIGTKRLIEDYISEVIRQLNIICDTESDEFPIAAKLEFFTHTRQAFGRTALLLSGGATMGLMHIGVVKTLFENKLLPRIVSGSSCGSIIAAILCTRTDEEIPSMIQFDKFNFTVFHTVEEQGDVLARVIHFLKNGALFDAQVLRAALKENIGDVTFQEAYNRTRRILNITVSTSANFEMPRLLNYLTAPNVLIWSAVATSCAAPFIYNSAPLMAKDKNGEEVQWNPSRYHWIDGSVDGDLPMNKLSELFNVNHFIVCQVNPYIVPFLQNSLARSPTNRALGWVLYQIRSEMQHRMNQLSILGVMPELFHKVQAIMSQRYYGDITIVPDFGIDDYLNIVSNPTIQFLVDACLKGERATWPKISIIKNHCSIEHCIDDILYRLRTRRLEAFRPPAGVHTKMSSENAPPAPARTVSSNTAIMRSSAAYDSIGRSCSSPASPTNSSNFIHLSGSPMEHLNLNLTRMGTGGEKKQVVPSTAEGEEHVQVVSDDDAPVPSYTETWSSPAVSAHHGSSTDNTTTSHRGTNATVQYTKPPLNRASSYNGSSAVSSLSGSPLTMKNSGGRRLSSNGKASRHRNSFGNATMQQQHYGIIESTTTTNNGNSNITATSRRSSSSSTGSGSTAVESVTYSSISSRDRENMNADSSGSNNPLNIVFRPNLTHSASYSTTTITRTISSTESNSPVPTIEQTSRTSSSFSSGSRSKTRQSSSSNTDSSTGAGGAAGSSSSGTSSGGRGKRNRNIHMTKLESAP
ncbi:acyl transferase/acyl hydrolase/lysophospholipase [Mortierella sp. GBAus27b]|nr:hypothetical protein BGX31_011313 [Mortierella sp. GBA43]KAI8361176.1 acyl transferase/acyl hydrolase/lysophospholipase [Mortierella sp. GBAus27b]